MKGLAAAAVVAIMALPAPSPNGPPSSWPSPCAETGKGYVAGTVLVGFAPKLPAEKRAGFRKAFGVIAERPMLLPDAWVMRVPCDADIPATARKMAAWPGVKYAEVDQIVTLDDQLRDP